MFQPTQKQPPPPPLAANYTAYKITATPVPNSICRAELERVVSEIASEPVRQVVNSVFVDLLRLVECLVIAENQLRQGNDVEGTVALFQIIHDEAYSLVSFIREDGLNCGSINADLLDTLDGISFAVNHDVKRVFEYSHVSPIGNPQNATIENLCRAHDILTNCLQQSIITLAMAFDDSLVGSRLFDNSNIRYQQSLQLLNDLTKLLELIDACENKGKHALLNLALGVEKFRNHSLQFLMYSDWPQFESFCERISLPGMPRADFETLLHQFKCYLETLVGHVKMRAELVNAPPVQVCDTRTSAEPVEPEEADSSLDGLPIAV